MVTIFCCLPTCSLLSKLTFISPVFTGRFVVSLYDVLMHRLDANTCDSMTLVVSVFVYVYTRSTTSPSFTSPNSYTDSSNSILPPCDASFVVVSVICSAAFSAFPQETKVANTKQAKNNFNLSILLIFKSSTRFLNTSLLGEFSQYLV